MEPVYYVSLVAQFLTYASFLSGAKVCHLIYKQKSCAKLSPMPFIAGLNCTSLWLRYGFIANEWEIIVVNTVGIALQIIYLGFFVAYSRDKSRIVKQVLILVIILLICFWSISCSSEPTFTAGSLASLSSLIACASPLATIQEIIKTKCVASLPFPIIISSFVVSLSWLSYGYLKDDSFIIFSNLVALAISGAQLVLFAIYPSMHPYEKLTPSNKKSYVSIGGSMIFQSEVEILFVNLLFLSAIISGVSLCYVCSPSTRSTLITYPPSTSQCRSMRTSAINHQDQLKED